MDYSISAAVDGFYPVNVSSEPGYFDLTVEQLHPVDNSPEGKRDILTCCRPGKFKRAEDHGLCHRRYRKDIPVGEEEIL